MDVELENALCDGHPVVGTLRARVYGADEALARGDEVELVADLAPVHLFLSDGADGARQAIARSGVAASGSVVEARWLSSRPSLARWIDLAHAHVRRRIVAT